MEQSAEDLRTEQYEPSDQAQSNVLPSFSVHTPDPFLSPAPLVADDVESPLEAYLSEAIERVQKRALNIIYPEAESYAHALQLGKLDRLDDI